MEKVSALIYGAIILLVLFVLSRVGLPAAIGTGVALWFAAELVFARIRRMRRITMMRNHPRNFYVVGMHPFGKEDITIMQDYPGLLITVPHKFVAQTVHDLKMELEQVGNCNGTPDEKGMRGPVRVLRFIMGEGKHAGESWAEYMQRVETHVRNDMADQASTEKRVSEKWELEHLSGQVFAKGEGTFEWSGTYKSKKS